MGTDTVNVKVNTLQDSELLDEYYVCPGDSADPMAAGSAFAWSPNYNINDTTIYNPRISPDTSMTYYLDYNDSNGCQGFDSIFITVNINVPTDAGPDIQFCVGDSVILGGNPTSPPKTTYLWTPNTSLNFDTAANPIATPSVTTMYIVNTFNDTCTGVDTVIVNVNQPPSLTTSNDTIVCFGDTISISAIGIGDFNWTNGGSLSDDSIGNPLAFPDTSTVYMVTLTDSIGCQSFDSVRVDVQPLPIIDAGGIINACKFVSDTLGGSPTGDSSLVFSWSPSAGLINPDSANPIFNLGSDTTYYLTATDSLGCVSIDSVEVLVFRIEGLNDTVLCENQPYTLATTTINGVGPFSYNWTDPSTLSNPNSGSPTIYTSSINQYTVTATDANNCVDTVSFNIDLLAGSTADFSSEVVFGCSGISVVVVNNSLDAVEYQWYINGELVSTEEEPELQFDYGKETTVTLITVSTDFCTDTAEVTVPKLSFEDIADVQTSDVFTPNNDGENDLFYVSTGGDLAECSNLKIFNRHGVLIFESQGGIFTWDGRSATGDEFPEGVYYYIFSVNGIEKNGNVTLLR